MGIYVGFMRGLRPFINEIVVLERNPLWPQPNHPMTVNRRSSFFTHTQWRRFVCTMVRFNFSGVRTDRYDFQFALHAQHDHGRSNQSLNPFCLHVLYPISLWTVVAYMGVARFMSYLDLRIRQEGW